MADALAFVAGHLKNPTELIVIFTETKLKGAFVIDLDRKQDARGFFARAFCQEEFKAHGLKLLIAVGWGPGRVVLFCALMMARTPQ